VRASFARWKRSRSTRVRAGDFRIVYAVRDALLVVLVVKIGNRRDVYR